MIKVHLKIHRHEYKNGNSFTTTNNIIKFFMSNVEAHAFKMGVMIAAKLGDLEVEDVIENERRKQWTTTEKGVKNDKRRA